MEVRMESSSYINERRRMYSLYVMQNRSIPSVIDGLKAGGRRVLWVGKDGQKYKTANLAGQTMPLHPHQLPSGSINTLTAFYGNNIPLFDGYGAFGTLLSPDSYGADRYTSVKVSKFTQDVIFRDIEIIPMMENYDGTEIEPVHFLPLVPTVLLNPSEGIAVGFATNILPRTLDDIINAQIAVLKGQADILLPIPNFTPIQNKSHRWLETEKGTAYYFDGELQHINATTIKITKLPYGQSHTKVINKLDDELEKGTVVDYVDNSKDNIDIDVKFKKGVLSSISQEDLLSLLGLSVRHIENLTVLDFTGKSVWNPTPDELISKFTNWRLQWYIKRYERLRDLLMKDLQKYYDIKKAIDNDVGGIARKIQSRSELKEFLTELEIVNLDYIADLPVYRFTEEEYIKNEKRIEESLVTLKQYEKLLDSEGERVKIYINELQEILTKYNKKQYATTGV